MINFGIIGYGKMGRIRHQIISSIENAQVDSIYDPANLNTEIEKVQSPDQIINNPKKNTCSGFCSYWCRFANNWSNRK